MKRLLFTLCFISFVAGAMNLISRADYNDLRCLRYNQNGCGICGMHIEDSGQVFWPSVFSMHAHQRCYQAIAECEDSWQTEAKALLGRQPNNDFSNVNDAHIYTSSVIQVVCSPYTIKEYVDKKGIARLKAIYTFNGKRALSTFFEKREKLYRDRALLIDKVIATEEFYTIVQQSKI